MASDAFRRVFLTYKSMRQVFESSELREKEIIDDPFTFWQFASEYSSGFAGLAI